MLPSFGLHRWDLLHARFCDVLSRMRCEVVLMCAVVPCSKNFRTRNTPRECWKHLAHRVCSLAGAELQGLGAAEQKIGLWAPGGAARASRTPCLGQLRVQGSVEQRVSSPSGLVPAPQCSVGTAREQGPWHERGRRPCDSVRLRRQHRSDTLGLRPSPPWC